jgi:hypothetical protein
MSKFAIDKDFQSVKAEVPKSKPKTILEIRNVGFGSYQVLNHEGDNVYENGCYTKEELKTLWQMLSTQE